MLFNVSTTKRVFSCGQYDRKDDFVAFNLSGDKHPVVRQFLDGEFYSSPICKCFNPLSSGIRESYSAGSRGRDASLDVFRCGGVLLGGSTAEVSEGFDI